VAQVGSFCSSARENSPTVTPERVAVGDPNDVADKRPALMCCTFADCHQGNHDNNGMI
jgi:hypothetical protein